MSPIEQSREESIVRSIYELCCPEGDGKEPHLSFGPDWGGNSLTIYFGAEHFHIGDPDGDDQQLTHELAMTLHAIIRDKAQRDKETKNAH